MLQQYLLQTKPNPFQTLSILPSNTSAVLLEPHGVISQKVAFFRVTAVKTSDLTGCILYAGETK
jgi:hypothetical protein